MSERVVENVNRALHRLMSEDDTAMLLGEDVADPYGGAFAVTRGLSDAFPGRVLSTPISENGIVGVANGLALAGRTVIVEMMFGDFVLLALDQIVNFAAKSVSMFGRRNPTALLVRCPVGGNRGYGATHSQSVQKFFVGVPDLHLWEVSPFVDTHELVTVATTSGVPSVLVEDKVLYTRRMFARGDAGGGWRYEIDAPSLWTHVRYEGHGPPDAVVVTAGSTVHRCLEAADQLRARHGIDVELAVPARLHPCDPGPVLPSVRRTGRVAVVEESPPGGSWGGELAQALHQAAWTDLRAPVELVTSADRVIPAAPHLERQVLVTSDDVVDRVVALVAGSSHRWHAIGAPSPGGPPVRVPGSSPPDPVETTTGASAAPGTPVVAPRLGGNDDEVLVVELLVDDGATVVAAEAVATVETSKTAADVESTSRGVIRWCVAAGDTVPVGEPLGHVVPAGTAPRATAGGADPRPAGAGPVDVSVAVAGSASRGQTGRAADRVQEGVAAAVVRSHRDIPAAFVATEVELDRALGALDDHPGTSSADLPALLLAALGGLFHARPEVFSALDPAGRPSGDPRSDVAVTVDAGTGLYLPVVRDVAATSLDDIADRLVEVRLAAVTGGLMDADLDLAGVGMGLSLNLVPNVTLVQPLIMPGFTAMLSVGGVRQVVLPDRDGGTRQAHVATLGLAHDHRVLNGRPAAELLREVAERLESPNSVLPSRP